MTDLPPSTASTAPPAGEPTVVMPPRIFLLALLYLTGLAGLFITYAAWAAFRANAPSALGPLPVGVVWFGAVGAVVASLFGIFTHNQVWKTSYNYWYYCRPLFGAITGSVGALTYFVSLRLGSTTPVSVDRATFYVIAFILGFADKAFLQLLKSLTDTIVKPATKVTTTPMSPQNPSDEAV